MKKILYIKIRWMIPCIMALVIGLQACDSFEEEPLNVYSDKDVWQSDDLLGSYAQSYLYSIYLQLPDLHNRLENDYLDSGTDDGMPSINKKDDGNVNSFRNGRLSARNVVDDVWSKNYTGIRRANVLIANVDSVNFKPELQYNKKQWKAEARFLRAFFYFELIKRWGGVPLIGDTVYGMDDKIDVPRNSLDECINYIVKELDAIEGDLMKAKSLADGDIGRVNIGACNALRSRVLLYAASPLYNTSSNTQKWKLAADAAKKVIDMNVYSLHTSFPELFYTIKNSETIFLKEIVLGSTVERYNSPIGYQSPSYLCKGYTSPSQNLVDAFLTIKGAMITDPSSGYEPQNPYKDRDPRLTHSIFYNGSRWLKRNVETHEGGLDRPNTSLPQTQTGYYLRKFMGNFAESDNLANTQHPFILFRYAEILLNYAEALNESDPSNSKTAIENALILIRKRAGIEAGTGNRYGLPASYTQDEMRKIIQNERRIELAFEEHRFFDIRRWKIAELVMNNPIRGMQIIKQGDGTLIYATKEVKSSVFYINKMYWYPIPYAEMNANPNMVQNQSWNF